MLITTNTVICDAFKNTALNIQPSTQNQMENSKILM